MKSRMIRKLAFYLFSLALLLPGFGIQMPVVAQTPYQKPPKAVLDVLNAPSTPSVSFSPARDRMLLMDSERYPTIGDMAEPMLRLAGLRINPNTNGPHRMARIMGLTLRNLADGKEIKIAVPANAHLGFGGGGGRGGGGGAIAGGWSPDGKHFAFTNTTATGIELWVGDAATGAVRRAPGVMLNAAYGEAMQWMPESKTLLCQMIVTGRGKPPAELRVPTGPNIQESYGKHSPAPTFEDLLKSSHDEDLFEYYVTSQLALVNAVNLRAAPVGKPAIFSSTEASPDGNHILVVRNHKPYSYILTANAFPKEVEVWDHAGKIVHKLASLPLADQVPLEGVTTGPRGYHWRPTIGAESATLVWVEALDGGDTRKPAPLRDRVLMLKAPFQGTPTEITKTQYRYAGITWGEKGLAFLRDADRQRRTGRTFLINVDDASQQPRLVWERSAQDRYNDPGQPVMRALPNGQRVMWQHGNHIYLNGQGASPQGDRPFLDRFDLTTLKAERLFRCDDKSFESVVALLTDDASRFITRYETSNDQPNYFIRSAGDSSKKALTKFSDPTPQLRAIKKQLVTYKRADGVPLSFTLYLPPDYKPGTALPSVIWAYPLEFGDANTAGQISGSTNRFTTISGMSQLFFVLQGYAVLDSATMPVIGDPETMNNTYVEQIVASAKAAIDKAVEMGVTDRNRVGVGGHSYGAFMTANLLAHSDLFKAGIARSGAYNRTLTPFGFQSERRTLWQAPDMYLKVSPFMFAEKIKEPILLIHGEADDNSGTFPIQSDRMYQAIKGNGGNVRYVTLPLEPHGYTARESLEHTLWEMITWVDKYVKNAQPATASR
ncbi:MAG: prolyl oligopeptidase family serine peptidase [Acidobacteriota bacterium]|nr:prolyl oligopeptidase family serine peptidase [Acidobacteriota bacterium]